MRDAVMRSARNYNVMAADGSRFEKIERQVDAELGAAAP